MLNVDTCTVGKQLNFVKKFYQNVNCIFWGFFGAYFIRLLATHYLLQSQYSVNYYNMSLKGGTEMSKVSGKPPSNFKTPLKILKNTLDYPIKALKPIILPPKN